MTTITVLAHPELAPETVQFDASPGRVLCDALADHGVHIEHACEKSCVCTTCHVIIREGFDSLRAASDDEEDQLGKAWGLEAHSRLSCQVKIGQVPLVVEIPRYTMNLASERR